MNANLADIMRTIIISVAVLLIPLLAMQFSDEVYWTAGDFAVAAALLLGASLLYVLVIKKLPKKYRIGGVVMLIGASAYVWAELSVGILTSLGS